MQLGAKGAILALADFLPELCVALYNAVARAMVANRWSATVNLAGIEWNPLKTGDFRLKYAMDCRGYYGAPRAGSAASRRSAEAGREGILADDIRGGGFLNRERGGFSSAGVSPALFGIMWKFKTSGETPALLNRCDIEIRQVRKKVRRFSLLCVNREGFRIIRYESGCKRCRTCIRSVLWSAPWSVHVSTGRDAAHGPLYNAFLLISSRFRVLFLSSDMNGISESAAQLRIEDSVAGASWKF